MAITVASQGAYNLLLAIGIFYALLKKDEDTKLLFTAIIWLAAAFGAFTVQFSIIFMQGAPAFIASTLLVFANKKTENVSDPHNAFYWFLYIQAGAVLLGLYAAWFKMRNDALMA